jgi:hypothetical protein
MKKIVNPGYRNHPCDYRLEPEAASENRLPENGFFCCRCGAVSTTEENLCAPQKK